MTYHFPQHGGVFLEISKNKREKIPTTSMKCQDLISRSMAVFCLRFPTTSVDAYSEGGQEQYREIYDFKQERCFVLKWCFALEMHNEHNCEIYDFE